MVIVIDAAGNILNTIPERVYQGSNLANDIVLVGVIPVQSEITIAFTLPNGVEYEPQLTTRGVASFDGKDQYYWRYVIPAVITEYAGKVTFDFYVYNGSQIVATGAGGFLVERGVPGILPATPTADIYQQILQELAKVQGTSNDALLVAQQAKEIAEGVDGKATEALEKSAEAAAAAEKSAADAEAAKEAAESISGTAQQALTTAQEAKEIAEGIDGKATEALEKSAEALEKSTEAMAAVAKEIEEHTIVTSAWTALSGSAPYTYSATVTVTAEISQTSVIELYNNNAVLFANYGFAIGAVSGQTVTVYSIGLPTESVTLTIQVGG